MCLIDNTFLVSPWDHSSYALGLPISPSVGEPVKQILFIFFILHFLALETAFGAGVFRITNRTYGNLSDPTITAQIDELFNTMETQVNAQLAQFDAESYLKGTANATALASTGGTHDLANRFRYFYVSVGGGIAADLGGKNFKDFTSDPNSINSAKGLSGNMSITIGAPGHLVNIPKMNWFEPQRFKLYMSYSQFDKKFEDVNFEYLSYSLMGQYHFFGYHSALLGSLKWHGVDVTTGFKYSKIKVLFSKSFNETVQQQLNDPGSGNPTMTMNYASTGQLGASANITTVPIEVSTSVGLLYFLDGFVGLGTDLNFGSASSIISAPGSVTATEPSNILGTMAGDIEFDLGQKSNAQALSSRYLMGFSFDLRVLSLTLQYNHNMSNSAESLHLSLGAHF